MEDIEHAEQDGNESFDEYDREITPEVLVRRAFMPTEKAMEELIEAIENDGVPLK